MSERHEKEFYAYLTASWIPGLTAEGFIGVPWTFQRRRDPYIDVVWLQAKSDRTACSVNLGVHLKFLPAPSGKVPDLSRLEQADCEIKARLTPGADLDFWWEVGRSEKQAQANAAHLVDTFRTVGTTFFHKFSELPGPFASISPEDVANGKFSTLLPIETKVRAALLLARVYEYLGDFGRAQEFARVGLENSGKAVGPRKALRDILGKRSRG